ncbi:Rossmann-fold NAD(P)-binding domain-containing protein [Paenibacillus hexagrammi]|uniref:D-isomer specific 2-hydroxyacid dehydrogenase catalytic domain-containing protein n=1 Tax=Paenibacillus hexagrammi TaxID=2908839 RepID=A0ABY3SEN3_9BACL|nr:hypothetical protein [Paenibacillus sp. YPD9-1]UJF31611.1 hypothetical protein L0M14_17600 [Paenibacillus sp. YPD9-1]
MKIIAITGMDLTYLQDHLPKDLQEKVSFQWFRETDEAIDFVEDADAIVTTGRMHPKITAKAAKLKWVQTLSAGVDKLPLKEFAERNIILTNARGYIPYK